MLTGVLGEQTANSEEFRVSLKKVH